MDAATSAPIVSGAGSIEAKERLGPDWRDGVATLAVTGGAITDTDATIELAPIPLVVIAGELTDVRLHFALAPTTQVELAWSFTANGGTLPLAPQTFTAAMTRHDDALDLAQPGSVWMWADVLELDNFALRLRSSP